MNNPAADFLMETIRQLNETVRRAQTGEPTVDDYVKALASDPVTKWFSDLLREKRDELEKERLRADRLASAGRHWYAASRTRLSNAEGSQAEMELYKVLGELGIVEP